MSARVRSFVRCGILPGLLAVALGGCANQVHYVVRAVDEFERPTAEPRMQSSDDVARIPDRLPGLFSAIRDGDVRSVDEAILLAQLYEHAGTRADRLHDARWIAAMAAFYGAAGARRLVEAPAFRVDYVTHGYLRHAVVFLEANDTPLARAIASTVRRGSWYAEATVRFTSAVTGAFDPGTRRRRPSFDSRRFFDSLDQLQRFAPGWYEDSRVVEVYQAMVEARP